MKYERKRYFMPSNTVWSFSSEPSAKDTVSAFID